MSDFVIRNKLVDTIEQENIMIVIFKKLDRNMDIITVNINFEYFDKNPYKIIYYREDNNIKTVARKYIKKEVVEKFDKIIAENRRLRQIPKIRHDDVCDEIFELATNLLTELSIKYFFKIEELYEGEI